MKSEVCDTHNKRYFYEIDVLKAIGIFLVVVGHSFPDASLPGGIQKPLWNLLFHLIYSFHMPLFVVAAGVLVGFSRTMVDKRTAIYKRARRLLVPYIVWGVLYIPFRIVLSKYSSVPFRFNNLWKIVIGDNPYSGLWFLYALFVISFFQILIIDSERKLYVGLVVGFVLLIIGKYVIIVEPIKWFCLYSFYYLLGVCIKHNYTSIEHLLKKKSTMLVAIIAFSLLYYIDNCYHIIHGFVSILIAVAGILAIFCISVHLQNNRILVLLGQYSMDIYILSGPILVALRIILYKMLGLPYNIYIIVAILVAFGLPVAISSMIIRKVKLLRFMLLGIDKD